MIKKLCDIYIYIYILFFEITYVVIFCYILTQTNEQRGYADYELVVDGSNLLALIFAFKLLYFISHLFPSN